MKIDVEKVQLDKQLQPRAGIDSTTVGVYANCYEQLPPVDVFWVEGKDGWYLVDGWHRFHAAKQNGLTEVEVVEHQGTFDEALEFAFDANLKNGKPLTLQERKAAAEFKLKRHTERSDRWIGEDCGIDHKTVRETREQFESTGEIPQLDKLMGRDGKYRPRTIEQPKVEDAPPVETVKLYHGDMVDVLGKLDQKFDLVVADPPYEVTGREWDVLDTKAWLEGVIPHLNDKYHLFWFCAPKFATDTELIFRELGLDIQSRVIWHRRNMALGSKAKNRFVDTWEMIFHAGNKPLNFPEGWTDAWFDVQVHAVPQSNFDDRKIHPTQKPYSLIRRLVEFGSEKSESVLDPFGGGGTTGAACQEDDRHCVLIERELTYVEQIELRLKLKREKANG